jgi:hypothetical protein
MEGDCCGRRALWSLTSLGEPAVCQFPQVILAAARKLAFAFRKCLPQKLQLEEEGRVNCVSLYLCTTSTTESAAPASCSC